MVRIHAGVYREKVVIARSGTEKQPIRFEAAPGAAPIVTGADPLTGWSRESAGVYSIPWPDRPFHGDEQNPGGTEQVFDAGTILRKVPALKDLAAGTYFVDRRRKRLLLRTARNPDETGGERPIESSTRAETWIVSGAYVQTCGLRFCYAANRAQQAMALFQGDHDLVEDCSFAWSNSTGASFRAEDVTVRRCLFENNGQQGFTAVRAHRLRFDAAPFRTTTSRTIPAAGKRAATRLF